MTSIKNILHKIFFLLNKKEKIRLAFLFLLMIVGSLLEVLGVGMIPAFVVVLINPQQILEIEWVPGFVKILLQGNSTSVVMAGSAILLIIFLFKNSALATIQYINSSFTAFLKLNIERRLFKAYLQAPYIFHLSHNTSGLLSNLTQEITIIVNSIMIGLLRIVMNAILILALVGLLIYVNPFITLFAIIFLGLGASLFLLYIKKKVNYHGKIVQANRAKTVKAINHGLGGLKDARVLNKERHFYNEFEKPAVTTAYSGRYYQFISNTTKYVIETIAVAGMLFITILLVWQEGTSQNIISKLVLFGAAFIRLMPALQQLISSITAVKYALPSLHPIVADLQQLAHSSKKADLLTETVRKQEKLYLQKELRIQNLSYSYDRTPTLSNIDVIIQAGETVAFVGPSGAGKSTLVNLILGLLEPKQGQIEVDGLNIFSALDQWHNSVSYIPQDIFLLDDSIRQNIAFGVPFADIDHARIAHVVAMSQLEDFVKQQTEGLDTRIGERGTRISGGQRQRIGIARALYQQPELIVMDEATSALDNITEEQVMSAIENIRGTCTIIMIAHRLSTIQSCDQLYYLAEGKLINQGNYEELIALNKEFRESTRLQNK